MSRSERWRLAAFNAVCLATALALNTLANLLPLNGMTTGALSALYPNLFVPVGATFSIWGLIYSGLLLLVGYGFVLARSSRDATPLEALGPWLGLNLLANAAWIVAWHWTRVPVSVLLMGLLLGSLVLVYQRLGVGTVRVSAADWWFVHAPISLYLGWISVATIANATALAVDLGAPAFGPGPAVLTVAMLGVAVLLALRMLWARRDTVFALVVCWALVGIFLKRTGAPEAGSALVAGCALGGLGLLGSGVLLAPVARRRSHGRDGGGAETTR